ncbi:NF-kappa-B inhibitor cactus [Haematobia irritans]|uniref:NF-kappa-B inhibitor cactus n=1 Tax=Haematobia irritans TaxID=7368 RepID=UPI003F4F6286
MWQPTPSSSSSSDNKNNSKEVADDCKCDSSGGVTDQLQQPLASDLQRSNSKQQQTSTFGGQLTEGNTTNKQHQGDIPATIGEGGEKKFLESTTDEATDSGFISGPQTSSSINIIGSEEAVGAVGGSGDLQKFNIRPDSSHSLDQHKQQQYEISNLDSGCIDEVEDENGTHSQQSSATTTTAPNEQQMLLKNNVDAGMSEWFCNLSLQNSPAGTSATNNTTSAPQQNRTNNLNNLDAPKTRSTKQKPPTSPSTTSLPTVYQQQQQQHYQHAAAGSSATTPQQQTPNAAPTAINSSVPSHITPSNAWEYYYQQNDDGDTPLHLACISGYVDVVAALIRMAPHPCLFNIQNDEAQTPLHLATLTAQPKIIRMLLIAGAEPTVRDRHGNTALHLACMSGEEQCVRALTMSIGASEVNEAHRQYGHRSNDNSYVKYAHLPSDLEIRNYDGERCVHLAAQAGYIDILRILVLYGADINAREGKSGRTPLHIAIECCNEDLANFLLDECQKLNLETATYAGLTAYQVACVLNKSEMQDILEKRGAEPLTPPDSDYDSSDIETDLDDSKLYDRFGFGDPGYFVGYKGGNAMTVA